MFLLFAAAYFFINAPYTFFGVPEDIVWRSAWYDYLNIPLIIIENLFYLLFLQSFFTDITADKNIDRVFRFTLWIVPLLALVFILFSLLHINNELIYYTVKIIAVIPAAVIIYMLFKKKPPFSLLVANGLLCSIVGTCISVLMIILRNHGWHYLFTDGYPLFFIRLGILGDMLFYLAAILKKWHFQENQLAFEKLQSQLEVEKLRNKISGELHDDVGSTLSGINMYSYMITDLLQSGKYEEVKQSINIIQKSADEMTHKLSDLVWSINPERDTLKQLMERLEEYSSDMARVKGMKVNVNMPDYLAEHNLPVESKRNIYLFCKEAINNAVKYSNATLLELNVEMKNGKLNFSIIDNGKGFNTGMIKRGNGLYNMQKRADQIGAELILWSQENKGSSASLQYKIT